MALFMGISAGQAKKGEMDEDQKMHQEASSKSARQKEQEG